MKRFRFCSIFLFLCILLTACDSSQSNHSQRLIKDKDCTSAYLDHLAADTVTPDSFKIQLKELITDNMRWWGMDILTNNLDSIKRANLHHLQLIDQAMKWNKEHFENNFVDGKLWNQKGLCYSNIYKYDSAFYCFKQAYKLFTQSKCFNELSTTTINLAGIYYRTGLITTAAEYYKRASLLADSLNNTQNCVSSHIALAQIYADLKNFTLAQHHLDEAEVLIANANIYELYFYYFARGICYYYRTEYNKAYAAFNNALTHANHLDRFQQTMCQASLAESALLSGNEDLALSHISPCLETLKLYPHMLFPTVKFFICSIAANIYFTTGHKDVAMNMIENLPKDKDVVMLRYLSLHYNRMSIYAEKQKEYQQAFNYQQIANKYQNQINNENAINNIIEISQRYQRDTTNLRQNMAIAEIENTMSKHQLQLTIIITGLLLIICICIITIIVLRRRNEKRNYEQFKQIAKLRMDVVRNRVSPHYIFNVLGMMLPKFKSDPELHQISELFIDVIRGNLMASNELSIQFSEESRLVQQYVSLYHKTNSPYPTVNWNDQTNGKADNVMVPTMCLQIPVENALKHAFSQLNEKSTIDVNIIIKSERLILKITDNGEGYNPGKVIATGRDTGTGLRVLSRSIFLFNKHNSHHIEFNIKNLMGNQGTEVTISIPFDYVYSE